MTAGPPIDRRTGLRDLRRPTGFPVGPSTFDEIPWASWAERTAVVDGDHTLSYADLDARAAAVAGELVRAGVVAGDRVAWRLSGGTSWLIGLLATVRAGALWLGLSPRSTAAEQAHLVADAEPRLVLDELPEGDEPLPRPQPIRPEQPAAIAYTSGTTGAPKGAVHTAQQLLYPAAAAIATEGLDATDRIATPLPLSTLNLMLLGPVTAIACGGTAVMLDRPDGPGFAADIAHHRVTRALVVPTIVHDLVAAAPPSEMLQSLRRMILGGAGMDRARAEEAQLALGVPLVASYGLSEAPTGVARMPIGATGATPLPGIAVEIVEGEIGLRPTEEPPWGGTWQGTLGYWRRPEETERLWAGGVLHTGDAGVLDEAGRLLVTGRVTDMINRGGAIVAPHEVEAALLAVDGVTDAAVFALDDERLGQRVAAAVVGSPEPTELATKVRTRLSGYKVPERWLALDAIPRNANGKVDREALRRALRDQSDERSVGKPKR